MKTGRCTTRAHGCQQDMLEYADSKCSGQHQCQFHIIDIVREGIQPCQLTVMPYMEAKYECVAGINTFTYK